MRSTSDSKTRYSHIEKEVLALVEGWERFHYLFYGRQVMLETDHSSLVALSNNSLGDVCPRLQRFLITFVHYGFTLHYVPGRTLVLVAALSRDVQPSTEGKQRLLDVEEEVGCA